MHGGETPLLNNLLTLLSPDDFGLLEPHLERVLLPLRKQLIAPDSRVTHAYFLEHGLASVLATAPNGKRIEVGIIGPEGMAGEALIYGDDHSVFETFMQIEGAAWRIPAERLAEAIQASPSLHRLLLLYVRSFSIQLAYTALANGRAKLEERLARWLVMVQDRIGSEAFNMTHEFLAVMLGVRRPGVTVALQVLEGRGLIRSNRAQIVIIDRNGLIAHSNGTYGQPEAVYQRLFARENVWRGAGNDLPELGLSPELADAPAGR